MAFLVGLVAEAGTAVIVPSTFGGKGRKFITFPGRGMGQEICFSC